MATNIREVMQTMLLPEQTSIFSPEEHIRPWLGPGFVHPHDVHYLQGPLGARGSLRVMDNFSRATFDGNGNILAGDATKVLQTYEQRKQALTVHCNSGDWTMDTPFISGDANPYASIGRARKRAENAKRQPVFVVLVNHMVRKRNGLPCLSAFEEMWHYGVDDPYNGNYRYYLTEILYPYIVTSEEIVKVWSLPDVDRWKAESNATDKDWVDDVVKPALEDHEMHATKSWREKHRAIL